MRLRYFDAFDQLADAPELYGVRCHDVFGVRGHLLFQELEKAGDDRITLVVLGLALGDRLGRHEDGTVRHHRDFDLALELGVRAKKTGWQAHASGVADLHNGAFVLLFMLDQGHDVPRSLCIRV